MTSKQHTITLHGVVSQRPRARQIEQGNEGDTTILEGLEFQVTEARIQREDRDGVAYEVDPSWVLSAFKFDDVESQSLYTKVGDLQIGDNVTVEAAVVPSRRRGFQTINLRLLSLSNQGPRQS